MQNNNNINNKLIEAILNKDNKIIPLITRLIKHIRDNNNINNTEENLTNRQIVKYLNDGQYNKLKAFYPKVEEDFDRLEFEINEDKKNIELLDRQKNELMYVINNLQTDLEHAGNEYNELIKHNNLGKNENIKLRNDILEKQNHLEELQEEVLALNSLNTKEKETFYR